VKIVTCQEFNEKISEEMIQLASGLAEIEGLNAHKNAAIIRSKST
jgi:histidinol dehydrogenase